VNLPAKQPYSRGEFAGALIANAAAKPFNIALLVGTMAAGVLLNGPVLVALLAALGHDEELAMHVRATRNTGATEEDLREAMMHVAIYAGVPAANHAIKIIKQTYAEMAKKPAKRKKSR
jgi:hypothetical protein